MIRVEGPDGSIAEFPPDTSPDVIKRAMAKKFGGPQKAAAEAPGMLESGVRGALQGASFGFSDEIRGLASAGGGSATLGAIRLGAEKLLPSLFGEGGGKAYEEERDRIRGLNKAAQEANPVTYGAGEIAGGIGTGLGAAGAGATLMRSGMGLGRAAGAGLVEGGAYGALYGAGAAEQNTGQGAIDGTITGAAIGAAVPVVGRAIGGAIGKAITPQSISPERQALVSVLEREGVPISAGQRSGSKALQYSESFLGDAPLAGGQASKAMEAQGDAFTDAIMRRVGGSGRATPENISAARTRIGGEFERLSAKNVLTADRQMASELGTALREYDRVLPAEQRKIVGNLADDIVQKFQAGNGTMDGKDYQTIRSRLSRMAQNNRVKDPEFADAIQTMRDALDGAMARSISPEDAGAWQQARREWGNLKTVERAAAGAGENAATGLISPSQLRVAATSGAGKRGDYARGQGDFAELARAGNAIMAPLPNSGTAQRGLAAGMFGGAGASAAMAEPLTATILALGPGAFGRALWSGPVQAYLRNEAISPATQKAIEDSVRAAIQGGVQSQVPRMIER